MQQTLSILLAIPEDIDKHRAERTIKETFPDAVTGYAEAANLFETLKQSHHDLLVFDWRVADPRFNRQIILKIIKDFPSLHIVLLLPSAHEQSVQTAIDLNAFFYLHTPLNEAELILAIKRSAARILQKPKHNASHFSDSAPPLSGFIGSSPAMQRLFDIIKRVSEDDRSTVLIQGELGTGKKLVAKAIHVCGRQQDHPFVTVNCAAIPDDLLESELFGHFKSSFTVATQNKTGRNQYAGKGTLFLDEIGDMRPNLQAKLLRILQERESVPEESLRSSPGDTRIIAATHCDLEELVRKGQFREDLYYRLSVVPIKVPPLRERLEDIPLLLQRFIGMYTDERGRERIEFTPEATAVLMSYEWRGNVRELENLVQHMSIVLSGRKIGPAELPEKFHRGLDLRTRKSSPGNRVHSPNAAGDISREIAEFLAPLAVFENSFDLNYGPIDFNELINGLETELIVTAMKHTSGNKKEAARLLCLKRTTLLEKIKKKGLDGQWDVF